MTIPDQIGSYLWRAKNLNILFQKFVDFHVKKKYVYIPRDIWELVL